MEEAKGCGLKQNKTKSANTESSIVPKSASYCPALGSHQVLTSPRVLQPLGVADLISSLLKVKQDDIFV